MRLALPGSRRTCCLSSSASSTPTEGQKLGFSMGTDSAAGRGHQRVGSPGRGDEGISLGKGGGRLPTELPEPPTWSFPLSTQQPHVGAGAGHFSGPSVRPHPLLLGP